MYRRLIRNEISRDKALSAAIAAFVAASALLVALAATLTVHLSGSIEALMARARTPHFMQMHSGAADRPRLAAFAAARGEVEAFQVQEFLNVEASSIVLGGRPLGGSVQDNGLCAQGGSFDFLLDLEGRRIEARDGELYVPVCYLKDGSARLGDAASVCGEAFRVAGFLRDSQMNSLLSSSKRFLVSGRDFERLRGSGDIELLIEFRLASEDAIGDFESAYAAAGLEANGPTLTYPLFKAINAISDGLMIAVILLVSVLVTLIAFLCIRFALLAQVEDEYREIATMKALGIRASRIKALYLAKYAALAAAGALAGAALAVPARLPLLAGIRLAMGESGRDGLASAAGVLGAILVFLAVLAFASRVLGSFRRIPPAQALRSGPEPERGARPKALSLRKAGALGANAFLGLNELARRPRLYATMVAVFAFALFIMLVPRNLYTTIASEEFSAYMGIGRCDLRIDIQQGGDVALKAAEIQAAMDADPRISRSVSLTTRSLAMLTEAGEVKRLKVELGDHGVFPLRYSSGEAAEGEGEIALSRLCAEDLGKEVGNRLVLRVGGSERELAVSGIYSDITNGGKTAKASFAEGSAEVMWCVVSAELADPADARAAAAEYQARFPYAKVSGIGDFVAQTFGPTVEAIGKAARASIAVAAALAALVTFLFTRLLVAKDRQSIALMKALGFLGSEIASQYLTRIAGALALGLACGSILAATLGEALAGLLLSSFGASSFSFEIDPVASYVLYPLLLAASAALAAAAGAAGLRGIAVAEINKE